MRVKKMNFMWSSPESISLVLGWANWVLIASIGLGFIAAIFVLVTGNIEKSYLLKDVATANERASKANEMAEREKLERIKLEARLAPRTLSKEQQEELVSILSQFKGVKGTIRVTPSTSEGEWFVRVFTSPLITAGWEMEILPSTLKPTFLYPRGVVIQYPVDPELNKLGEQGPYSLPANALAEYLNKSGIEASAFPDLIDPPTNIRIIINEK